MLASQILKQKKDAKAAKAVNNIHQNLKKTQFENIKRIRFSKNGIEHESRTEASLFHWLAFDELVSSNGQSENARIKLLSVVHSISALAILYARDRLRHECSKCIKILSTVNRANNIQAALKPLSILFGELDSMLNDLPAAAFEEASIYGKCFASLEVIWEITQYQSFESMIDFVEGKSIRAIAKAIGQSESMTKIEVQEIAAKWAWIYNSPTSEEVTAIMYCQSIPELRKHSDTIMHYLKNSTNAAKSLKQNVLHSYEAFGFRLFDVDGLHVANP